MATLNIPITKAGKGVTLAVDTDVFNELMENNPEAAMRIVEEGLKVLLNSRMTKTADFPAPSKLTGEEAEAAKAKALAKAVQNLADLKAGKMVKRTAAAKSGVDRAVMTEAMTLAKAVVRNEIRKAGKKVSLVAAKDITAVAKRLVESDPSYIEQAQANLAERAKVTTDLDISSLITESPTLVAEAEARKAERKNNKQLSAKQAGKPEKRGKVPPRRPEISAGTAH